MKHLIFIVVLVAVLLTAGCVRENQNANLTPVQTTPQNVSISQTSQMVQNAVEKNGIIEYRDPEKINKPEDLQIGDLIQMSINDSLYDKDRGFIVENFSLQNNHFLIKEITRFRGDKKWFGIETKDSRLITSGALMRDYPYKFGHASEPLPQICMVRCWDNSACSNNSVLFDLGCGRGEGSTTGEDWRSSYAESWNYI